uniref:glucuronosyltransferase n=1 Tax=Acrobeloides nanus TaxID=290746 RepID=A0A914DJ48_9BILA
MISNGRIADELARAGHNVTLVEVEFLIKSANFKSANSAQILTLPVRNIPSNNITAGIKMILSSAFDENPGWLANFKRYAVWQKIFNGMCDAFLQEHQNTLEQLKNEKFDIIFAEQLNLCGAGLKEVLKIRTHLWVS